MIPGLRGTLLSADALEHAIPDALHGSLGEGSRAHSRHRFLRWHTPARAALGPSAASRAINDRVAVPLFRELGFTLLPAAARISQSRGESPPALLAVLERDGRAVAAVVVTAWGREATGVWRDAVRHGIAHGIRWCFCLNGPTLRLVDTHRTYSRQFVEFDLEDAFEHERTFAVFWGLLRAEAWPAAGGRPPLLEAAIAISEAHRAAVRSSLQTGVYEALGHLSRALTSAARERRQIGGRGPLARPFDESLIVIYRILFLLFAEARGLVPAWHPVFASSYTIESLRRGVELLPRPRGLWETLQAIARLAHRGCAIGSLRVTPFNGRLFSPHESPLSESVNLDDAEVRRAVLALTTREFKGTRTRIAYGDLGVEQLGGVYERLLDFESPAAAARPRERRAPLVRSDRRKATGSFYTPRSLTEYVVRRTLAPLVQDASPERILGLRVLDPAMGSGAFLVAACRYLANAYESAVCREQGLNPDDFDERDRAGFRRAIAQRCLYGVDINPMAVQLGRLSLWLATLAADRPLTFLDHRLRVGNSIVGASPADLLRDSAPTTVRRRAPSSLPLFEDEGAAAEIAAAIGTREAIANEPGDTLAQVRGKEAALARLAGARGQLAQWKDACDVWCARFFEAPQTPSPPFGPLADALFGRHTLPPHVVEPILERARRIAAQERFFHWGLEFPEVFHSRDRETSPGFDAVIGNPPWEMLRGDRGALDARAAAKAAAAQVTGFSRRSGVYGAQGSGHGNLYQLFVERMMNLVRTGGRLGAIVPWGFAIDLGAAALRRRLFDRMTVDTMLSFENRERVFPIHRSVKFLLLCAEHGGTTRVLPCRFGIVRPEALDRLPDAGAADDDLRLPMALVERVSGPSRAIPEARSAIDVELLSHCSVAFPALADGEGWNVTFGRELNATDDKPYFRPRKGGGLPVVEGKQLSPFAVDVAGATHCIAASDAACLLGGGASYARPRLAYRDVAASTNRLTLIAAIVPQGVVTTHTVFCLKAALDDEGMLFLCGMFNSFVANYLVRMRVTTHVTTAVIERLPMPVPARDSSLFAGIASASRRLCSLPGDGETAARLQALAARAYGLDRRQFRHVLDTFPLIADGDRDRAHAMFCDIVS
ncbi:MAG TPA: N-6 DNA methylase [Vicinamibacterales bacterium]|nr:N-6 DNA methylase [Vicinamibacterales bacterium]